MSEFPRAFAASLPAAGELAGMLARLLAALVIGAVIGLQRELTHKPAGLRTHLLVALGTTLLVLAAHDSGMTPHDLSRVIQGLITGVGFLGGGTILKLTREREIQGLTTAAGIWFTAAASIAAGLGRFAAAFIGLALAWLVMFGLARLERRGGRGARRSPAE